MQQLLIALVGPLLLSPQDTRPSQRKPNAPPPGVSVRLNVEEKKDVGLVAQCVLVNKSNGPIVGKTGYGGANVLYGASQRRPLTLYRRKASPLQRVIVKAGAEQLLFEIPLEEALFLDTSKMPKPRDREWSWSWRARPKPPDSPFHNDPRIGGLVPKASFWVATQVEGAPVESAKVVLKLKIAVDVSAKPGDPEVRPLRP